MTDPILFENMLANERSFDRLFCDVFKEQYFQVYYNQKFADDPVFNHFVLDDRLSSIANPEFAFEQLLSDCVATSNKLKITASIFVDKYLPWTDEFERVAIDRGFRIGGRMNLLTKLVGSLSERITHRAHVDVTRDVDLWNRTFMRSYDIPDSWSDELLTRERNFLDDQRTVLLLAEELDTHAKGAGCILLHAEPTDWMGVYCVGTVPESRHKGIANEMMYMSESIALSRGCKYLTLQTIESDGVTPMYQKLGYQIQFQRDILQAA
ncbi:MAG: GNAT family N-acetyltransferase [Nitrososphaerota archaeon]|nr:GNAT family N-acetyltransferase [Nitrososphaerota archaeon]